MTSADLKTEALCWLRFGKKLSYICTEVGKWNADAFGCNEAYSVEIEVKISKADLRHEFKSKAAKHYSYRNGHALAPNYFYFYVPSELVDEARTLVEANFPEAGLAAYIPG